MRAFFPLATSVVLLGSAAALPASAQQAPAAVEVGLPQLALSALPAAAGATLSVTTPAFKPGGDIPFENTQYRGNHFPGLAWTGAPAGTKSFAVIMQDTDALRAGVPILHWTMFNISGAATALPAGVSTPRYSPFHAASRITRRWRSRQAMRPRTNRK